MSYPIAALIAAVLGIFELHSRLKGPPTSRQGALKWWSALWVVEASAGVLTALAIDLASDAPWAAGWEAGLAAGIGGPAAARLRVVSVGKGEDEMPYGLATLYKPFRDFLEHRIDRCGAARYAEWIRDALRALNEAGFTPEEVGDWIKDSVLGSMALPGKIPKAQELKFIDDTVHDERWTAEQKIRTLIQRACELDLYETVERLVSEARTRVEDRQGDTAPRRIDPGGEDNPAQA